MCLLAELAALAGNGIPDEEVGDEAGVGDGDLGDGGGVVLLQPGCDGGSLIGVPIPCHHRLCHNPLQGQKSIALACTHSVTLSESWTAEVAEAGSPICLRHLMLRCRLLDICKTQHSLRLSSLLSCEHSPQCSLSKLSPAGTEKKPLLHKGGTSLLQLYAHSAS